MSVHVVIEHGIPMPPPPPRKRRRVSGLRWALMQMEIGDCFVIKERNLSSVKSAANFARTKIKSFTIEADDRTTPPTPMLRVFKVGMRQMNQKGGDNHMAEPKTTTTTTTPKPETPKPTTTTTTEEEGK